MSASTTGSRRDVDLLDIAQGGFGSAGSGNRSMRRIATRGGVSTTSSEMRRRSLKRVSAAAVVEPPPDELKRWIEAGRCWWCGDNKQYKSLSQHWTRGHGIDLQLIKDHLDVPKGTSFIAEETRRKYTERGKRLYNPEKLKARPGTPHPFSAYGKRSQKQRVEEWRMRIGEDAYEEHIRAMRKKSGKKTSRLALERRAELNTCIICGAEFPWSLDEQKRRKTCSDECDRERRSRAAKRNISLGRLPAIRERRSRFCKKCGILIKSHRKTTCSEECSRKLSSEHAKATLWKLQRAQAARLEKLAQLPMRLCEVDGCAKPHAAKGLCGMHYQRLRAELKRRPKPCP